MTEMKRKRWNKEFPPPPPVGLFVPGTRKPQDALPPAPNTPCASPGTRMCVFVESTQNRSTFNQVYIQELASPQIPSPALRCSSSDRQSQRPSVPRRAPSTRLSTTSSTFSQHNAMNGCHQTEEKKDAESSTFQFKMNESQNSEDCFTPPNQHSSMGKKDSPPISELIRKFDNHRVETAFQENVNRRIGMLEFPHLPQPSLKEDTRLIRAQSIPSWQSEENCTMFSNKVSNINSNNLLSSYTHSERQSRKQYPSRAQSFAKAHTEILSPLRSTQAPLSAGPYESKHDFSHYRPIPNGTNGSKPIGCERAPWEVSDPRKNRPTHQTTGSSITMELAQKLQRRLEKVNAS